MKFIVNSSVPETDLSELKDLVAFLDSIEKRQILIELQQKQEESKRYLKKIKIGNKSEKKKKTSANAKKVFNGRNDSIKFVDNYGSMTLEAKKIAAKEELEPEPPKAPSLINVNILQVKK